jgi:hypothetical protein
MSEALSASMAGLLSLRISLAKEPIADPADFKWSTFSMSVCRQQA